MGSTMGDTLFYMSAAVTRQHDSRSLDIPSILVGSTGRNWLSSKFMEGVTLQIGGNGTGTGIEGARAPSDDGARSLPVVLLRPLRRRLTCPNPRPPHHPSTCLAACARARRAAMQRRRAARRLGGRVPIGPREQAVLLVAGVHVARGPRHG